MNNLTGLLVLTATLCASSLQAFQNNFGSDATNKLGVDLYRILGADGGNLCFSPYSIQSAFAMTANGAGGKTLQEMQSVLHYPPQLPYLNVGFLGLADEFAKRQVNAEKQAGSLGRQDAEPRFQLMVANRLFGQKGYRFDPAFLSTVEKYYRAPLQLADFAGNHNAERLAINEWVAQQTRQRISNLLPGGSLDADTRLVLTNALYFKAAWKYQFKKHATRPAAFHLAAGKDVEIPTMHTVQRFGYARHDGYTAVSLPYAEGFAMVLLVPDEVDGLAAIEKKLTVEKLSLLTLLPNRRVSLHLPKFKLTSPSVSLKKPLQTLGMKSAFNAGTADFSKMIAGNSDRDLFIGDAYHKTFLAVDESGTEAAAATAVVMKLKSETPRPDPPVAVRVDRPFFYAIMDTRTRTALFLGRVADPR